MKSYRLRLSVAVLTLLYFAASLPAGPFDPVGPTPGNEVAKAMKYLQARPPRTAQAIELLKKALIKNPNAPRLHYVLGMAYAQDNKPDLATAEFRDVLRKDPDFVEAHVHLARLMVRKVSARQSKAENLRLIDAAIAELQQAVKKTPHNPKLYYDLAKLHADAAGLREKDGEQDFEKSLQVLAEAQKRAPQEPQPHMAIGNTRIRYANYVAGGKRFTELKGNAAKRCKDLLDKAEADFRKVLAMNARYLMALDRVATIKNSQGQLDEAIKVLERHVPKLKNPLEQATCYRWMGQYLIRAKKYKEAEAKFSKAIETEPRELASYLLLADTFVFRDLRQKAVDVLLKAVKINANLLNAYVQLGVLEAGLGKRMDAAEHFRRAVRIPWRNAVVVSRAGQSASLTRADLYVRAAVQLGEILMEEDKFDEAIAEFTRLGELLPNSPLPEFHIGQVHRRKGDPEAAKEHYQNALRRNKGFVQARAALAEMEAQEVRFAVTPKERAKILVRAIDQYQLALESIRNNALIHDRVAALRVDLAHCSKPADRAVLEQALLSSKAAVNLAPAAPLFRLRLARIHHALDHNKEALEELQKLIEEAKALVKERKDDVRAIFRLADLRTILNSWQPDKAVLKQALDGFNEVVKKQPKFLDAYLRAAVILDVDEKAYANSAEWYKRLLSAAKGEGTIGALTGRNARLALHAAAQLAWIYCEHLNNLPEANKYATLAMQLDATLTSLIDTIGWIRYKEGKANEAIPHLRRAFKTAPSNATVGYHLGAALLKNNNAPRALEALKAALPHVGGNAELKAKIETLIKKAGG